MSPQQNNFVNLPSSATPQPVKMIDRKGERGSALLASLVLLCIIMALTVGASQVRVAAMRGQEQQEEKARDKWQARSGAATVSASLRGQLPRVYEDDLAQARAQASGVVLPAFDAVTVAPAASLPLMVINASTSALEPSGTPPATATSLLGQSNVWATTPARIAETYAGQAGFSADVVRVFSLREVARRSSGGDEPAYVMQFVVDARGGEFYRVRPSGLLVLGPNDTTCGTAVQFDAAPTSVVSGNSTALTAQYGRAKRLRVRNSAGTVIFDQSVTEDINQQSAVFTLTPAATDTYQVEATGSGTCSAMSAPVTVTVTPPPCPVINSFAAAPSAVVLGGSSVLSWNVSNATSVNINGTPVPASGTLTVTPGSTTTYTLSATGPGGFCPQSASVTVTVSPCPSIQFFNASQNAILRGDSVTLTWNVNDAAAGTTVSINGSAVAASGSLVVSPNATTTYNLQVVGPGSCAAAQSLTITVSNRPCPSIQSFSASLTSFQEGGTTVLSWTVANAATGATIQLTGGGLNQTVAATGSQPVTLNTAGTYIFTLTATSTFPECPTPDQATVTVTVTSPPPPPPACPGINSFTANASCVVPLSPVTLSWNITWLAGDTVSINETPGFPLTGSTVVMPVTAATYTLQVSRGGSSCGTQSTSVFVDVSQPAPQIQSYAVSNTSPLTGQMISLSWNISGAVSADINGVAVSPTSGSITDTPTVPTDYVLTTRSGRCSPQVTQRTIRVTPVSCPTPVIQSFTVSPSTVLAGGQLNFNWSISDAQAGASIMLTGPGVSRSGSPVDSATVTAPAAPGQYSYVLSVSNPCNPGNVVQQAVIVNVVACPAPQIASFTANPTSIVQGAGGFVRLSWTVNDTSGTGVTVSISPGVGGGLPATGFVDVSAPAATTTYTLTVTNGCGEQATNQLTVTVTPNNIVIKTAGGALGVGGGPSCSDIGGAQGCIQWEATLTGVLTRDDPGLYTLVITRPSNVDGHAYFRGRNLSPFVLVYGPPNSGFFPCNNLDYFYDPGCQQTRIRLGTFDPYLAFNNMGNISCSVNSDFSEMRCTIPVPAEGRQIIVSDAGGLYSIYYPFFDYNAPFGWANSFNNRDNNKWLVFDVP